MEETKIYRLLEGYRNLPAANVKLLEEILVRFSQMLVDFPQIKEADINPLFIDEEEAFVLDARIMIDKEKVLERGGPYEHLSITPYPRKYEDFCKLQDGQKALLRPVKPEDEPLLTEMFNSFKEFERNSFVQKIRGMPHEFTVRICNIDYDRELAVVAELAEKGRRKIAGIARLITAQDGRIGEITFIVADSWQGSGLREELVDYLVTICLDKNIEKIHCNLLPDDHKSIKLLKKMGFNTEHLEDETLGTTLNLQKRLTKRA
jgi:acetyltransferase